MKVVEFIFSSRDDIEMHGFGVAQYFKSLTNIQAVHAYLCM